MDILSIGIGLAIGAVVAYLIATLTIKKDNQKAIEESNRQADLVLQEARLSAKRMTDEAQIEAQKVVAKAESENERIKQQKIQEAKERYAQMRSQFDSEKADHVVKMKERELQVVQLENDLKAKEAAFQQRIDEVNNAKVELENKETELLTLRENLERQLHIVQKKREELDAANEERIKALEKIASLSQQDAKDQLLEAVRAKSETESMAIVKEEIGRAHV